MTGLLILAIFGLSAVSWDRGLLMKSIALSEIMPGGEISLSLIKEIYAAEKEHNVIVNTNGEKDEASKKNDNEEKADKEKADVEETKDSGSEPKYEDYGTLFVMSEAEKADYSNLDYLKKNVYIVDSSTGVFDGELNGEKFLNEDFSIDTDTDGPKILIFHTHSHEGFADSDMSAGADEGIVGVGERLKDILETEYGIETMHCTESFDYVDSKMTTTGAYERMEPVIRQILDENPSIEIAIDLHRDGVADDTRLVTEIDGKSTAQIMFFNGLCRVYENGELVPAAGLDNANLEANLAFSFAMKYAGYKMFPGLVRRNYLKAYRYSLHMLPKSLLVEVGAQTNTKEEALNAMEPLAEILVAVINKNT